MSRLLPVADRLWSRVVIMPSGCLEWTGAKKRYGYGTISDLSGSGRKNLPTHRLAWELTYGPIPDGLFICHRCDNPPCCNPDHLFLGTHTENMADMRSKGRHGFAAACAAGHPWTEESTRHIVVNGVPARRCRLCRREQEGIKDPFIETHCRECKTELARPGRSHYCGAACRNAVRNRTKRGTRREAA